MRIDKGVSAGMCALVPLGLLPLVAAACGDDDDTADTTASTARLLSSR